MNLMKSFQLKRPTLRKKILDFSLAMTILVVLSSLPFLHELIIDSNGNLYSWVPDLNIANSLVDANGKILGYSRYHVFLYFLLIQVYTLIAWIGWFSVSKNKSYHFAILMGVFSSAYQILLIISNSRKTNFNNIDVKLIGTAVIGVLLYIIYYYFHKLKRKKLHYPSNLFGNYNKKVFSIKLILTWLAIFCLSTGPYFHDIISISGEGVKDWIPKLGLENLLTDNSGLVWGFNSYRIFLLNLSLQVFAQIGWAGWLHDSKYKLYRPFLIVPVGLSLYQIILILFDQTAAFLNLPDTKLVLILGLGAFICYFYFFNNKGLIYHYRDKNETSRTANT